MGTVLRGRIRPRIGRERNLCVYILFNYAVCIPVFSGAPSGYSITPCLMKTATRTATRTGGRKAGVECPLTVLNAAAGVRAGRALHALRG